MASGTATGTSAGGSGSDCEGEEPEDPSSSLHEQVQDIASTLTNLNVQDNAQDSGVDELSAFRQQWQRELESTTTPQRELRPASQKPAVADQEQEPLTDEDKAKQLFLNAVELERGGKLYEAIQQYKRAMQILPDVETRLYDELRTDTPEGEESETEEVARVDNAHPSDDEDAVEGEDLLARLQRIVARKGVLCEQEHPAKGAHVSWLPYEVVQVVLRWVVSAELDAGSLERAAAVCRGLYVAAREPDIWRSLCVKTWGIDCGTPRTSGFSSWRQMYVERPRLQLHGVYISKTTYIRHGENSFQDQFYRPWYLIDYYRYLRFFPDGLVLMYTTAEEPAVSVGHLKYRLAKPGLGIMTGHYRLIGDKVVIMIKKTNQDKKQSLASNTRFRPRRKEVEQPQEQTFHMELELRSVRSRRNAQLVWRRYSVCSRRDQWTHFDLSPGKFPPFAFSRVRNFTAESHAPLLTTHAYT
ncbi:F-box only protein 9 [Trichoplusia ni]|uniref:F-box only protein 9 n=1 Tax=Trichoplusia ni TaxID=7111 RepID=A0A7E5VG40_TRINI|nr:F-box only protein 9 [Trichoplusia ni]